MTGTTSSTGRTFMDFDTYRNQEWLRRRKLRLEQVRKQSNEIAKALRQKVMDGEKARVDVYERMSEVNFRDWKSEKLAHLQWKLRAALVEFGESHRLAEEESELKDLSVKKNKINLAKAQKRGKVAQHEELKKKKLAEEKRMSPIQRKQVARKKEDLRSALICSVSNTKQLINSVELDEEKICPEKVCLKKVKIKKKMPHKSCLCKCQTSSKGFSSKGPETVWINLNKIQTCQTLDSGLELQTDKSFTSNGKNQTEKPEGSVEFYDFSSRYHSKSFREVPYLVERIESELEVLNADELAKIEEMKEKEEAKKKMESDILRQERGMEALKKEKIQRDYNDMIAKLEKLNKKEKILKAQQRNTPMFFHMNDERLLERTRTKQRMMDAKFESIYNEAIMNTPEPEQLCHDIARTHGGGDYAQSDDELSIRLSFSPFKSKPNSPVMFQGESSRSSSSLNETVRRPRKSKKKQQLLSDIELALKKGRDLRKTVSKNWESKGFEKVEEENKKEATPDSERSKGSYVETLPSKSETKMRSQESQTDKVKHVEEKDKEEEIKSFDKYGDESLPVSSSTSYKSPPSVIRSLRLRQFLASLEAVGESNDKSQQMLNISVSKNEGDKVVNDLLENSHVIKLGKNQVKTIEGPTLEYYIEKLLDMSRECIANLSVSSENISTPNITDLDAKDEKVSDLEFSCIISSREEDTARKPTQNADQLKEKIKNWKKILRENSQKVLTDLEDVPDSHSQFESERKEKHTPRESLGVIRNQDVKNKYEEITKKCSERISELSNMLEKVRRDKQKLLSSSSGSNLSLNKDEGASEKELSEREEDKDVPMGRKTNFFDQQKTSVFESFINSYNLSRLKEETAAMVEFQPFLSPEESLDSWPDVMDELIKKEILTSPFKWSDGECSSEFTKVIDTHTSKPKPSSIESVIGNFRKEMRKIKPFSLSGLHPQEDSQMYIRQSSNEKYLDFNSLCSQKEKTSINTNSCFKEEGSVESINQALTSLGLNWAKSFLRKNEESRAMTSSSNSVEKSSEDEQNNFC